MNVASRLASGEAPRVEKLLGEAAKLASADSKVPAEFVAALFGGAAPEDVANYSPGELAAIAGKSFEHLRTRPAGAADIQIYNPAALENGGTLPAITIIEIENEDMPFLLDSVTAELVEQGVTVRLAAHPIFSVERESNGKLTEWRGLAEGGKKKKRESFIHLHVARIDEGRHGRIADALQAVLEDVRLCVEDWPKMKEYADDVIDGLQKKSHPLPGDEIEEAVAFLKWLRDDHFTFLGCRDNVLMASGDSVLEPVFDSGLGILRRRDIRVLSRAGEPVSTSQELREFLKLPLPLIVTKANLRSRVHRRAHMDYIGIKRFDKNGKLSGERRIVGLFTSPVYRDSVFKIPFLRRKAAFVLDHAGFSGESHSGKALTNVLETYPRDDLFQVDRETLLGFSQAILQLDERPRVRVLARRDRFNRFVSVIVFVPRDRYDSAVRVRIGAYLAETYQGRVSAFYPFFPEGPLTRVHFIIGRDAGETPNPAREKLEADISAIVRNWQDRFVEELDGAFDPERAQAAEKKYRNAFSAAYREAYGADVAVDDIKIIDNLSSAKPLAINFYRRGDEAQSLNLKVWNCERPMPLSERVPLLENMGFNVIDERTYTLERCAADGGSVWLHDMTLARADGSAIDAEAMDARLEAALMAVLQGRAENDGFNALVLNAGMPWRDVTLVRTLARYLRQAAIPYSQDYLWATLNRHAPVARDLVALFHTRFDPRFDGTPEQREAMQAELRANIETALGAVQSLDEDRILRRFTNLIGAAVRTNYYQIAKDGGPRPTIAVKFESRKIDALPLPRPLFEIFVYAPRVEGVHLRFGKVARGGIRWSDRPQDFRTEVLGLVKAQQVKNAVIVPVGAKGGFVPKQMPANPSREAFMAEGTEAYKIFIRSLLDITDNLSAEGAVIAPENTVRHDADDPYLVVAADKGTATFSDTANALAIEHGFWLGDAFASGGSAGYDHKKMGITARGAWEAVKRHFREMDVDISKTPFTVAGVGDMSGDVFGNGMLLEKTIKLIAAFDHRDIFFDPSPDPETSFAERARVFALARSSWQDYDKSLLSKGGGVFPRSLKAIPLSPEMQIALSLDKKEATPAEVMNAILKMPVDLLWFGGIGTYIRASSESDAGVGDRANDAIRISGAEVAAKVVGEGANLGMTQRGRIEAARKGVRLNTDAIDNSAGVNSSDVEVNLKIALATPVRAGMLSLEDRNKLLAAMTPDVASLVLRNNYLQTLAISLVERDAANDAGFEMELMRSLERRGLLDRSVEYLPSDMELAERQAKGLGLTRPELAVTLAYAKLTLFDDLVASDVPDEPYFNEELLRYFPDEVPQRFPDAIETHRLRREIIATRLGNSIINRGGPAFVTRIANETGAPPALIAKAYAAVRDSYRLTDLNNGIDALDAKIPGALQLALYETVKNLLLDRVVWFVRNADFSGGLAKLIAHYREGIDAIEQNIEAILPKERAALLQVRAADMAVKSVPETLAAKLARLPELAAASDIVLIAGMSGQKTRAVAETYFAAEDYFRLDRVLAAGASVKLTDHFDRLAFDLALSHISTSQRRIVVAALQSGKCGADAIEAWASAHKSNVDRARRGMQDIAESGLTLAKLTVAANVIGELAS